jgi:putative hydrolase of the HAD superfamily
MRAVLLDLDGTLVDRNAALRACLRRRAGLTGVDVERLLELDRADSGSLTALSTALLELRPGLAPDVRALVHSLRQQLPDFITPDAAIGRALTRLARAKLRLALVTNGGPSQRRKLAAAKIAEQVFASIHVSGELGHAKPEPAIFQAALAALGVAADQALMIGDSPHADIAGAARLAIPTCWLSHRRRYPASCPAPTLIAIDLPEAVDALLAGEFV